MTLRFADGSLFGFGERLVPVGDGVFHPEDDPFTRIVCESGPDDAAPALTLTSGGVTTRYPRVSD